MVLEYLQIQNKARVSLCFSASPPRIGYLSFWMHEGLSSAWLITPRGISATRNMKSRLAIKFPHPQWVVIKCPPPGRLSSSNSLLPGRKRRQMPGVCPGGDVEASIWLIHNMFIHVRGAEGKKIQIYLQNISPSSFRLCWLPLMSHSQWK